MVTPVAVGLAEVVVARRGPGSKYCKELTIGNMIFQVAVVAFDLAEMVVAGRGSGSPYRNEHRNGDCEVPPFFCNKKRRSLYECSSAVAPARPLRKEALQNELIFNELFWRF